MTEQPNQPVVEIEWIGDPAPDREKWEAAVVDAYTEVPPPLASQPVKVFLQLLANGCVHCFYPKHEAQS